MVGHFAAVSPFHFGLGRFAAGDQLLFGTLPTSVRFWLGDNSILLDPSRAGRFRCVGEGSIGLAEAFVEGKGPRSHWPGGSSGCNRDTSLKRCSGNGPNQNLEC